MAAGFAQITSNGAISDRVPVTLLIAGERSGCGKTTVTLMLLAALSQGRVGKTGDVPRPVVQSFKVGPDYIDPMFHRHITGRPCYNLDPILTSAAAVHRCFDQHQRADYSLIEGVMGLFDGAIWPGYEPDSKCESPDGPAPGQVASSAHVAALLQIPIVLVIDCGRLSGSVAAIAQGYKTLAPQLVLAGVVLNRVGSDRHLAALKVALAQIDLPILGVLRRQTEISLPDRHLGLVPTDELPEFEAIAQRLGEIGAVSFNWEQLLPLLKTGGKSAFEEPKDLQKKARVAGRTAVHPNARIAVARDRAFNFQYAENLELLESQGAELLFWSPITDTLPTGITGLYLSGGFPEVFAQQLSENILARSAVKSAIASGLPTYAECGGLMYLCQILQDLAGQCWPMAGVLPTAARMEGLTLGYRRAIAQRDTPLLRAGETICGHEFHHSKLNPEPAEPLYRLEGTDLARDPLNLGSVNSLALGKAKHGEGWGGGNLHASYVHLHWGAHPEIAARFIRQGLDWRAGQLRRDSPH